MSAPPPDRPHGDEPDSPFLGGHGWGFGGGVDHAATDPWNVPGRYGWAGGAGTAA